MGGIKQDNQPIAARFGDISDWLTNWITPDNPQVRVLYQDITGDLNDVDDKVAACWHWVANEVKYKASIHGKISVEGRTLNQNDLWLYPAETLNPGIRVGNCACKSFLLASLALNASPDIKCVMGNVNDHGIGGHAWVEYEDSILESTQPNLPTPFISKSRAIHYDPVLYFDNASVYQMPGKELLEPLGLCAIPWLGRYLCQECLRLEV